MVLVSWCWCWCWCHGVGVGVGVGAVAVDVVAAVSLLLLLLLSFWPFFVQFHSLLSRPRNHASQVLSSVASQLGPRFLMFDSMGDTFLEEVGAEEQAARFDSRPGCQCRLRHTSIL